MIKQLFFELYMFTYMFIYIHTYLHIYLRVIELIFECMCLLKIDKNQNKLTSYQIKSFCIVA